MRTNTSNDFVELCVLMDEELNEPEPWMWYMAQIAMEIAQGRSKKRLRVEDYLIKFVTKTKHETTEEERAKKLQASKNYWMAITGLARKAESAPEQTPPIQTIQGRDGQSYVTPGTPIRTRSRKRR